MIISHDIQYSGIIKDVIDVLEGMDSFTLKIWVDGSEIPFKVDESSDIEFLEESVKISNDTGFTWILYGIIMVIRVMI